MLASLIPVFIYDCYSIVKVLRMKFEGISEVVRDAHNLVCD